LILRRNAIAMDLSLGDTLIIGGKEVVITGLVASPEYIYLVQNERSPMAQPQSFGVVLVVNDFFDSIYNEIVARVSIGHEVPIDEIMQTPGVVRTSTRNDQANYNLYRDDLGQIRSFAYIFPLVFAVLIAVVIYVMLSRTIQKDRKQIGTMKALGVSNKNIINIYLMQFLFSALLGAALGGVASVPLTNIIIEIFGAMFEVPTLNFAFFPSIWLVAFGVAILLCLLSGIIALSSVLPLLPSYLMRPRQPKGGRRLLIERVAFLWKALTFNSRYAIKNSLRNKGRFAAVVMGMCGACTLLAFSLGFNDSILNTQNRFFNDFANYDVIVNFDPMPLAIGHPVIEYLDESQKALAMPVEILENTYIIAIVQDDFDMLNVPNDALKNGVVIPDFFAERWGVGAHDVLQINGYEVVISAIHTQHLGLILFTSFDYINSVVSDLPPVYNTIYGRSADMETLSAFLIENAVDFSTIDDDRASFYSIMESMSVLILFMLACTVILGFTVLYSVGMINLSAREYEYMFMGVMGYPHKGILTAHFKETVIQLALAIPLGFIFSNVLLESIRGEFSRDSFVISTAIFPQSYAISATIVIAVTVVMGFVTSRHIGRLDIVEGLKAQDD